ncbi:RidA family protein [Salinisphaera sp. USBA-960]|uniref:Rid family detoxifying hydrolase n=1 Tax=Salinisphaera orenii TaxID=856731 RepID=UPI000DBE3810|nr:RidA family protein [Salifodinibacter halophilus]NNC26809.1 RidA family protein [Salifodinibacter halophilus]
MSNSTAQRPINTDNAPAAIGPYSQAFAVGETVYVSGQIPLDPATGALVEGDLRAQTERVFDSLEAIAAAAGGSLSDAVRIGIYLTDMSGFGVVNEVMAERLAEPYPSRAAIGVAELPKGAAVEADAILVIG